MIALKFPVRCLLAFLRWDGWYHVGLVAGVFAGALLAILCIAVPAYVGFCAEGWLGALVGGIALPAAAAIFLAADRIMARVAAWADSSD